MHRVSKMAGRLLLPLVMATAILAAPGRAAAQAQPPSHYGPPGQYRPPAAYDAYRPDAYLSQYLALLGQNPNNLAALVGAGRAALDLGEGEAALNFYGRAEELSPQDGSIKAGLGSALVLMEQPETALQFFYEAYRLGIQPGDMAAFRGLAYDLTGDPARAQQDYNLALRRREDPEVRRRLALSLAISGQRDAALAVIQDQIRRQDRAAWRTRAFILALTGDAPGAARVVESTMPGQSAAMAPFLARLPSLSAADRARAVHFGHFPGQPRQSQGPAQGQMAAAAPPPAASSVPVPRPADPVTSAGRPDPRQPPWGQSASTVSGGQAPTSDTLPAAPRVQSPPTGGATSPAPSAQAQTFGGPLLPTAGTPLPAAQPPLSPAQSQFASPPSSALDPPSPPPSPQPAPSTSLPTANASVRSKSGVSPPAVAGAAGSDRSATAGSTTTITRLADLPGLLAGLSDPPAAKPASSRPPASSSASAKPGAGKPSAGKADTKSGASAASKTEKAAPKETSRIWVQLARTPKGSAAAEFRRIRAKAAKPLTGKNGWTAEQGQNQRLLVGPFKTSKEAQDFVTALKKEDLEAFSWTSADGQQVKQLPAK